MGTVRDHEDDAVGVSSLPLESDNACAVIVDYAEAGGWIPLIDQLSALWIEREGCVDDDAPCGVKRRLALDLNDRR